MACRFADVVMPEALAGGVGMLVTLRGRLDATKRPTVIGVDVNPGHVQVGELVEATGWLEATTVTQAQIDAEVAESGEFAHRGPGTFYRLVAPSHQGLATARTVD